MIKLTLEIGVEENKKGNSVAGTTKEKEGVNCSRNLILTLHFPVSHSNVREL